MHADDGGDEIIDVLPSAIDPELIWWTGGSCDQGRIGPAAPPPFGRWAPGSTMHFFMNLL